MPRVGDKKKKKAIKVQIITSKCRQIAHTHTKKAERQQSKEGFDMEYGTLMGNENREGQKKINGRGYNEGSKSRAQMERLGEQG